MPRAEQRAQQMRELFAQFEHIVAFGLEQFEQDAQVRSGERRVIAVRQLVHTSAEIVGASKVRAWVQESTLAPGLRHRELDAGQAPGFRIGPRCFGTRLA